MFKKNFSLTLNSYINLLKTKKFTENQTILSMSSQLKKYAIGQIQILKIITNGIKNRRNYVKPK